MRQLMRSIVAAATASVLLAGGTAAVAGPSGAIFTTNADGSWVNGNVYDSADAVYLNGGPRANQSCGAAGLPDDSYYFQVTDPAGKELLSDYGPQNGIISVKGGMIVGYDGSHETGEGRCATLGTPNPTVKLWPFGPTPNPGGEYKVWMTPVGSYACDTSFCGGSFGFFSSSSKTDNFKVQAPEGIPD
ncbi:MAG TPA: hypothetical protein VHF87_04925 [Methylomirabilota bacterium]|jgi:hypothetical protein|nr:hypothetical protein [Methylomirabilota bacterium]